MLLARRSCAATFGRATPHHVQTLRPLSRQVKLLTGGEVEVDVEADTPMLELKRQLFELTGAHTAAGAVQGD